MKKFISAFCASLILALYSYGQQAPFFEGKIIDASSGSAIAYAHIVVEESNIGTVSNSEGVYALRAPVKTGLWVKISCLGYSTQRISISDLRQFDGLIKMKSRDYLLEEVVITPPNPRALVSDAFQKIRDNYCQQPLGMKGFYREYTLEDDRTVELSEALLDARLSAYGQKNAEVQLNLLKGRKSVDSTNSKSLNYWSTSGIPHALFANDVAHDPKEFNYSEWFKYSEFELIGIKSFDDLPVYEITFDQKEGVKKALYKGRIIIDKKSQAIVSMEYKLSSRGLPYFKLLKGAQKAFAAMARIELQLVDFQVKVNYNKIDSIWYLNNAVSNLEFRFLKKNKDPQHIVDVNIHLGSELLISDLNSTGVQPFHKDQELKYKGPFTDKIGNYDPAFWEGENYILPSNRIKSIAEKLKDIQ